VSMLLRRAVFLLVLANLLLFAWAQGYLGKSGNPDAQRVAQQVLPEQLRIVSRGEPVRAPSTKDESDKTVDKRNGNGEVCQVWSDLANADADQVERLLGEQFAAFRASRRTTAEISGYWVFVPPLASKDEASRKVAELEQLGVQEFFVVTGGGPNQLAISLGTYRSEAAANTRLEALRAKGVKSARVGERKGKPVNALEIRGPEAQAEALRQAIVALLPKASSPSACKVRSEPAP